VSASSAPIHQTLHGYEDGHRLLAGSVKIGPQDRRRMLTMSDSPDAAGQDPERSLMLGYPLPSESYFILSRTWAAPEVDRPGCVWTHSLLIDRDTQAQLDPRSLLGLFRRPNGVSDASHYESPIGLPTNAKRPETELPEILATLLWTLYQPPLAPVDLRADALKGIDQQLFLLTIWGQQWPALRSRFTFGQAPRVGRRLDGILLDLQITERPQKGSWDSEKGLAPPRTVVKPVSDGVPSWSVDLCEDLSRAGPVRDYLWKWGPARGAQRTDLWALASLFAARPERKAVASAAEAAIYVFERAYPKPGDQTRLKRGVFEEGPNAVSPGPLQDADLLAAIAADGMPISLRGIDLRLRDRSKRLVRSDPVLALQLVEEIPSSPDKAQLDIAEGIANGLTKTAISRWSIEEPKLLAKLVNRSPVLAAHTDLWKAVDFKNFWPLVKSPRAVRERRRAMLLGMLNAHSKDFIGAAFDSWSDASELYLELLAEGEGTWHSDEYLRDLDRRDIAVWLRKNGPAPRLSALILEAWKPKHLAALPGPEWEALWELGENLSDHHLALYFIAACEPESGLGPQTAVDTYQALHERSSLKSKATKVLSQAAIDAGAGEGAEPAAALLDLAFRDGAWSPLILLEIDDPAALKAVLVADNSGRIVAQLAQELGDTELPEQTAQLIFDAAMNAEDPGVLRTIIGAGRGFIPWFKNAVSKMR
jgi:hypothetical protein